MNNRRSFLKKLMLSVPAGYVLPGFLSSCTTQNNLFADLNFSGKVIVIGAGAAGLHAASILHRNGVDVQVLEATNSRGGRIRKLEQFTGYPLELGAASVRGKRSVFYDSIRISNFESYQLTGENLYSIDGQLVQGDDVIANSVYREVQNSLENLRRYMGPADIPVSEFLEAENTSEEALQILNALVGNRYGTDNDRIGIEGYKAAEANWTAGEEEFILRKKSFNDVLDIQYSDVIPKVRLNTPVKAVDYSGNKVVVTDHADQTYEADKLIVTVPLSILKEGSIEFNPPLLEEKLNAMENLGMDNGMKIFLRFAGDVPFWGNGAGVIYPGGTIPEFTVPGWGRESQFNDNEIFFNNILIAHAYGASADFLSSQGPSAINFALQDLDEAFNGQATPKLTESYIMDWSKENFIKGAYSYPKPGSEGAREILAAPIDNKVYFAGEATHTEGHFGTVHGAMETGYRAAYEVLKSIS